MTGGNKINYIFTVRKKIYDKWEINQLFFDSQEKRAVISKLELFSTEWSRSYIVLALDKVQMLLSKNLKKCQKKR